MSRTWTKRLATVLASLMAVFGLAFGINVAHADTPQFVDTSVQADGFSGVFQHSTFISVAESGSALTAPGSGQAYVAGSQTLSNGCVISVTTGGTLTIAIGVESSPGTKAFTERIGDANGNVEVVFLSFTPNPNPLNTACTAGSLAITGIDTVAFTPTNFAFATDDNVTGGVVFHSISSAATPPNVDSYLVTNLPTGLAGNIGTGELLPGTAIPGYYNDVHVQVMDTAGAVSNGMLHLKVNGNPVESAHVYTGTVVNLPTRMCLDVRNAFGHAASGETLQLWACGAAGGEDQQFMYSTGTHQLEYEVAGVASGFCVSEATFNGQAQLLSCGAAGSDVHYSTTSDVYRYDDGTVLDNAGFRAANGNHVLTYAYNGGSNQTWSLPR